MQTVLFLILCLHSSNATELLAAYIGAVDAPSFAFAQVSGCNPAVGQAADGMPVTFDVAVDSTTMAPDQFAIITPSNATLLPSCSTLEPADGEDEGHTVLLTGDFVALDGAGQLLVTPERIEIIQSKQSGKRLKSKGGQDLTGLSTTVIRFGPNDGPRIALAFWFPNKGPNGQVQTIWEGGITAEGGEDISDGMLQHFFLVDTIGNRMNPMSFEELGDGDNYVILNLPDNFDGRPERVEVDAGTVFDPMNYPNPANTTILVRDVAMEDTNGGNETDGHTYVNVCYENCCASCLEGKYLTCCCVLFSNLLSQEFYYV